ncbi:unnamed protein product [Hyaloperonospora brassicae]|uniref:TRAM domain-containing protein n=1 Tax=Hyaloperonospora brassicae TaxID=162125 RepID=A0AAV0V0C1_HYABA|nr:unnamed protein product [Hyaloperonospora brassicae]
MTRWVAAPRLSVRRWTTTTDFRPRQLLHTRRVFSSATAHRQTVVQTSPKRRIAVSIEQLNGHGDGIGTYVSEKGVSMQVIVPFGAPGDELEVDVWDRDVESREKWADDEFRRPWPLFGQQRDVLQPSRHRVRPQCSKYFGRCGGCKLQHVSYRQQLREKQKWIRELFGSRTHSLDMEVRDIRGVETDGDKTEGDETSVYQYRNKMEFTCSTGRWLLEEDEVADDTSSSSSSSPSYPFTVGMFPAMSVSARRSKQIHGKRKARGHRAGVWSPRILSLRECLLQSSACNKLLQQLVSRCEEAGVKAYDFTTHEGHLKQIVLRRGLNREGRTEVMSGLVTTTFSGEQSELLKCVVRDLVEEHETSHLGENADESRLVSVVESLDGEAQRHRRKREDTTSDCTEGNVLERVLYGDAHLEDAILGHTFKISFDSFFQPNSAQTNVLYREIQAMIESLPAQPVIWDLFCGVGSIGICMGAHAKRVVGFELVEAAVERARVNAQLNGYGRDHMQFFCVDLTKNWQEEELLDKVRSSSDDLSASFPDVVIVDPPRAGLHKKLIKMLRRMAPRHICYVSCNPHSQARDLEEICARAKPEVGELGSYCVRHLQPVDMLPHTPHIETIAWLERRE